MQKITTYVFLLFLFSNYSVFGIIPPNVKVNKRTAQSAFEATDGPLTEFIQKTIVALETVYKNSGDILKNAEVAINNNSSIMNKIIYSDDGSLYKYDITFTINNLELSDDVYSPISGTITVEDDCSAKTTSISHIQVDLNFSGNGDVQNLFFYFNNKGISGIFVNKENMTDELLDTVAIQAAKYIEITKNILSDH